MLPRTRVTEITSKTSRLERPRTALVGFRVNRPGLGLELTVTTLADAVCSAEKSFLSELRSSNSMPVVHALAEAQDLYDFLKTLLNEDLMPLQHCMENYSDELLRSDTIFALMEVQRLFKVVRPRGRTGRGSRSM